MANTTEVTTETESIEREIQKVRGWKI